jgi:hypothetical protein
MQHAFWLSSGRRSSQRGVRKSRSYAVAEGGALTGPELENPFPVINIPTLYITLLYI